jgi:hypothetical protein
MLKRGLSVQFAGDRESAAHLALFGHRTIETKTSERSLLFRPYSRGAPMNVMPCERHARIA